MLRLLNIITFAFFSLKEWYYNTYVGQDTEKGRFIKRVESSIIEKYYSNANCQYETADQIAMAMAVDDKVIQSSKDVSCQVCLGEPGPRGLMLVEWRNSNFSPINVTIATSINMSKYKTLLIAGLS